MNVIKKYFTLKKIFIFFAVVFVVLFCAGGCSFLFMDWQHYKFKHLIETQSGIYIIDDNLYKEIENKKSKLLPNGKYSLGLLSNGYEAFYQYEDDLKQINSRILSCKRYKRYYIDDNGIEHIISFKKLFSYITYGLWLSGDEGNGWRINYKEKSIFYSKKGNIFYKDLNDQ